MELIKYLESNGYYNIKQVGMRGLCGLKRFAFTVGICEGLARSGYSGRWCYENSKEATEAFENLNDKDEPMGEWIKYKGARGEYANPNIN